MKKKNKINLPLFAKEMGTRIHKTDSGLSEFVRFRTPTVKGLINIDKSGGLYLKIPGLDCFDSSDNLFDQIDRLEKLIKAYDDLKPDLKRIKQALKKAETVIPEKGKPHVERRLKKSK